VTSVLELPTTAPNLFAELSGKVSAWFRELDIADRDADEIVSRMVDGMRNPRPPRDDRAQMIARDAVVIRLRAHFGGDSWMQDAELLQARFPDLCELVRAGVDDADTLRLLVEGVRRQRYRGLL